MKRAIAALALGTACLVAGCGGGGDSGASGTDVTTATVTTFTVGSHVTGVSYPISVYVPRDAPATGALPTIYALDAETRFDKLMLAMQEAGRTNVILVGIGNTGAGRRQVDFLMPGAADYYRFLVEELVPAVESRFRADPARRILSGHSSSGLFAGYALFMETPVNRRFATFISAEGSFWQQPGDVAQAEARMFVANAGRDVPITVVLGGDSFGNGIYVEQMHTMLLARNYAALRLEYRTYGLGHVEMDVPFFRDALTVLLGPR